MKNSMELDKKHVLSLKDELQTYILRQEFDQAKVTTEQLKSLLKLELNMENSTQILINVTIAKYYKKISNYDKSANYSRQAINIIKKTDQLTCKQEIIECYLDYAGLEREYKQFANARILLATLLSLLETNKWQDWYAYGLIHSNLARIAIEDDEYDTGITHFEKALGHLKKVVPITHPVVSQTIYLLADAYCQLDAYQAAIEIHYQLREAYQTEANHYLEAKSLIDIGKIYYYTDLKRARHTILEAVEVLEDKYKVTNELAQAHLMLAELEENMNNHAQAIHYYKKSLDVLVDLYPETHFMIVYAYSKIGTLSMKEKQLVQAKVFLEKGISLSADYPKIRLQFLHALGRLYSVEKGYDQAYDFYKEFLDQLEKDGRKKSKGYGDTLQAIGFNFMEQEKYDQAITCFQKVIKTYDKVRPECPEEKGLAAFRLAHCYENNTNVDSQLIEECYEIAIHNIEKARNRTLMQEALTNVIGFYARCENPVKKRKYENKLEQLQYAE